MFYNIFRRFGVIFALENEREQMFLGLTSLPDKGGHLKQGYYGKSK